MEAVTCPACAAEVKPGDLICFTCGSNLPRNRPDEDPPAPATVMQEYLRHDERTGPISSAVLRLAFPTGNVEVPAGTSLLLGRDPAESLVAAAFAQFDNVSRRHATVTVDDAGHAYDPRRALHQRHVRQRRPGAARDRGPAGRRGHRPARRRRHRGGAAAPAAG